MHTLAPTDLPCPVKKGHENYMKRKTNHLSSWTENIENITSLDCYYMYPKPESTQQQQKLHTLD